jgi:malonyl-CoA O-methyltransferase
MGPPTRAIDSQCMRGNFSKHAADYDSHASVQKRVVEHLCQHLSPLSLNAGAILDIGTGTGSLAAAVTARWSGHPLVLMDIAHGMTTAAAQRLSTATACDGDARQLPFADTTFTAILSSSVYQWVDGLPAAFTEVCRVLQPGGWFAAALFGDRTLHELRACHDQAIKACGGDKTSHVQSFPTVAEVLAALAAAGLECRHHATRMEIEYHPDVPHLLRQLKKIGASNAAVDRPRGLASRRVMRCMMAAYDEQYRAAAGLPASYEVILVVARKRGWADGDICAPQGASKDAGLSEG